MFTKGEKEKIKDHLDLGYEKLASDWASKFDVLTKEYVAALMKIGIDKQSAKAIACGGTIYSGTNLLFELYPDITKEKFTEAIHNIYNAQKFDLSIHEMIGEGGKGS